MSVAVFGLALSLIHKTRESPSLRHIHYPNVILNSEYTITESHRIFKIVSRLHCLRIRYPCFNFFLCLPRMQQYAGDKLLLAETGVHVLSILDPRRTQSRPCERL